MTSSFDPKSVYTRHLGSIDISTAPLKTSAVTGPLDLSLPWVIDVRVVGTPNTIQVQVRESMLIGRSDADQQVFPEIDLLPFNAFAHGVSRRHAVVEIQDSRLYIKDLGSTNGTHLNGARLKPHEPYRLRHGDQLTLGQMRLQVLFAVVPMHDITGRYRMTEALKTQTQELARLAHNKLVLVIEDDMSVAEVFRSSLSSAGFRVRQVNSVVNALSAFLQETPDAIVLDLMLPDFNGLDFLRYVRKHSPDLRLPVIVVSASSGSYQAAQAIDAGADAFLTKPVSVEDLVAVISRAVGLEPQSPPTSGK